MSTELETRLRTALRDTAAQIPRATHLTRIDYHPRTRARIQKPRLALAGVATAAGTTAAIVALTGGATSAFAGWTPKPSAPTRAQLAAAKAYCAANVPTPGLPLALVDTRGPFTFEVYSDGATDNFCTIGPSWRNASGWTASPPVSVAPGRLFLWADHTTADRGPAYTFMIAQAADDVTAATLTLDDGSVVTATVEHGWAVAWWPSSHHVATAELTTPSGTHAQTFKYPCDVRSCTGGPHGGSPNGGPGGG